MKAKVKLQFILRGSSATSLHERLQLYMYIHQFSFNIDYIERQTGLRVFKSESSSTSQTLTRDGPATKSRTTLRTDQNSPSSSCWWRRVKLRTGKHWLENPVPEIKPAAVFAVDMEIVIFEFRILKLTFDRWTFGFHGDLQKYSFFLPGGRHIWN